jgi:hypothetical protein
MLVINSSAEISCIFCGRGESESQSKKMLRVVLASALLLCVTSRITLPAAIVNDPSIEVELMRCRFETNEYTYKIVNGNDHPVKVILYGDKIHDDKKDLNYAVHELPPWGFDYNVVASVSETPINDFYAMITVMDERSQNMLVRKWFYCEDANRQFVQLSAYILNVESREDHATFTIKNFYDEPHEASVCIATGYDNGCGCRYCKKETKFHLKDRIHTVDVPLGLFQYCDEDVEFYLRIQTSTYGSHSQTIHKTIECPKILDDSGETSLHDALDHRIGSEANRINYYHTMIRSINGQLNITNTGHTIQIKSYTPPITTTDCKCDGILSFLRRISVFVVLVVLVQYAYHLWSHQ